MRVSDDVTTWILGAMIVVMKTAEVVVIGLGAMGSATAYQVAKLGVSVIGIDQFRPPHTHGSTHGDSRITRQATGEGAQYVPLVLRSQQLWREIEAETNSELFTACGALMVRPSSVVAAQHGVPDRVAATVELAKRFGIEHEVFSGEDVRQRFPLFNVTDDFAAYYEPGGGFVRPERAVAAQLELAERHGAQLQFGQRVIGIEQSGSLVKVRTVDDDIEAKRVVLSVGSWARDFVGEGWSSLFRVHPQSLHWFGVEESYQDQVGPDQCPVYIWSWGNGPFDYFYGFPAIDGASSGMKVATEQMDWEISPDETRSEVSEGEALGMFDRHLAGRMLSMSRSPLRSVSCLYTITPDHGFVIDQHPEFDNVTLVSPCSGHGFKHSAAIGEAVAQRVVNGTSTIDLSPFELSRFAGISESDDD